MQLPQTHYGWDDVNNLVSMLGVAAPAGLVAKIPSPSSGAIDIGPLSFRAYGLMIAFGVLAGVWLAQKRFRDQGGNPDDIISIAMWAVPAGLVGARLYHVITDNQLYFGNGRDPIDIFKIWQGGLGIPGGVFLGTLMGLYMGKRKGVDLRAGLDAAAPAIPLAQAIGRWGNWWNQELFGRPTDAPWAVEITDPFVLADVPEQYAGETLFHPTFLYESLWNFALVGLIIMLTRWGRVRRGRLFAVYMIGYGLGRLWVEALRIDPANTVLGLRVNIWMSIFLIGGGLWWLLSGGPLRKPGDTTGRDAVPAVASAGAHANGTDSGTDGDDDSFWTTGSEGAEVDLTDSSLDEAALDADGVPEEIVAGGGTDPGELERELASGDDTTD
jgi:prolipoprotein diacylglyceryl transferase